MGFTARNRHRRSRVIATPQEIVERAEACMRAHIAAPIPLFRLCRIVGISERGLRNAFYRVRGMGPKRCMVVERLEGVRKALRDSRTNPTTVTDAAMCHGFYELGRFAANYRKAFGEAPSETLRCRNQEFGIEQTHKEGASDVCTT